MRRLCDKISKAICEVVCRHTLPDLNSEGKPVNVWQAKLGYDAIKKCVSDVLEEPQKGDIGKLINWLDLGEGLYRYKIDDRIAYEICVMYKRADATMCMAELCIVGGLSSTSGSFRFGRLKLMAGSLNRCLDRAKKGLGGRE